MKQLYILFIFLSTVALGNEVWAQVRPNTDHAPLYNNTGEFSFSENSVIDPRSDVRLYPNPAVEYLVVEINSNGLSNVSFELNNIIGNTFQMRSEAMGNNMYKIYVKDLRQGYYFLTIKDDSSSYKRTYRFLKK